MAITDAQWKAFNDKYEIEQVVGDVIQTFGVQLVSNPVAVFERSGGSMEDLIEDYGNIKDTHYESSRTYYELIDSSTGAARFIADLDDIEAIIHQEFPE